jgi:hypothetical protein
MEAKYFLVKDKNMNSDTVVKSKRLKRRNLNGQKTHEKMLTIFGHKGNANQNHTKIPPHPY